MDGGGYVGRLVGDGTEGPAGENSQYIIIQITFKHKKVKKLLR